MLRRITQTLCAAIIVGGIGAPATIAAAATANTSKGGAVKIFVSPTPTTTTPKNPGKVLITGAIGDYGSTVNATSAGKPTAKKGSYSLLRLKKGTILVNTAAISQAGTTVQPSTANTATCTFVDVVSAPIPIVKGTGAYAGISGTFTTTGTIAGIFPQKNGKCVTTGSVAAFYIEFEGTGTITL
jgi:hypothetical protein